ncbi:MAG: nucleoside diphosphate kinase regulator [Myxococcales bacterium]
MKTPEIILTSLDLQRLQRLLETHAAGRDHEAIEYLDAELARAHVVLPCQVPSTVVTMNTRFRFIDRHSGESHTATLVYPPKADSRHGRLSVLAPVGCALLGLGVGQTIDWPMPQGRVRTLGVAEILYQPEAAGQFEL